MIMRIRREVMKKGLKIESVKERLMTERVRIEKEKWRIIDVYVERSRLEEKLQTLENWMSKKKTGTRTIIGEDFNARTGREKGELADMEKEGREEGGMQSMD